MHRDSCNSNSFSLGINSGYSFFPSHIKYRCQKESFLFQLPAPQGRSWRCHWGCCSRTRQCHLHDPRSFLAEASCRTSRTRAGVSKEKTPNIAQAIPAPSFFIASPFPSLLALPPPCTPALYSKFLAKQSLSSIHKCVSSVRDRVALLQP